MTDKHPTSHSLLFALISALKWELLRTFIPRAAIIAFSYAQTFLITAAIHYLDTPWDQRNRNHAYGLIGASALIYIGRAVSKFYYNRLPC
jgi:ATP-binding cassette subfamily C (CFTR/MRP) protein 1